MAKVDADSEKDLGERWVHLLLFFTCAKHPFIIIIIVVSLSHCVHVQYTFRVCPLEHYCFLKDCIVGTFNFMLPFQVLYVAHLYFTCILGTS